MTNDIEQRTRRGLAILAASVDRSAPPIEGLINRATRHTRTRRTRTLIACLVAVSLSGGVAAAVVVLRTPPTREALTSGTTLGGQRISISEFKQTLPDTSDPSRSHRVSGLCIDVFGPQGAGPSCFNYDAISKGPHASVFKNNRASVNGRAHTFTVSFLIFKLPNGGLSKAAVTADNYPDIALDYFVDSGRRLVFALAYSDLPRGAGLTTVSPRNAVRRSHLDIVRYPKETGGTPR